MYGSKEHIFKCVVLLKKHAPIFEAGQNIESLKP